MRYFDILMERVQPHYYMHVSPHENLKSILKHGLIPNKKPNYAGRWQSLEGVYATDNVSIISSNIENKDMMEFVLVIMSIVPQSVFLDEDHIEAHAKEALIKCSYVSSEDIFIHVDEGLYDLNEVIEEIAHKFHETFKIKSDPRPMPEITKEFIQGYLEVEEGMDDDPAWWAGIKTKTSEYYKHLETGLDNKKTSIRVPNNITYRGRNRIVAVVEFEYRKKPNVVYGEIPPQMKDKVESLI